MVAQRPGEGLATLVQRADEAMYQAKQTGRNRVFTNANDLGREAKGDFDRLHVLLLYWRQNYECGIPEIDAEHMKLFKIANRILASLSEDGDSASMRFPLWMNCWSTSCIISGTKRRCLRR